MKRLHATYRYNTLKLRVPGAGEAEEPHARTRRYVDTNSSGCCYILRYSGARHMAFRDHVVVRLFFGLTLED